MLVEAQERFLTPTIPDLGGRLEPNSEISGTTIEVGPFNRISTLERPQRMEINPYLPKNSPAEQRGFLLHRQMVNLINGINRGINQGLSLEEAVEQAIAEPISNIRHHANEYTRERPLLVGNVKRTDQGVVNKYNNEPVVNHLDWEEREGQTAKGNVDVDKKILKASDKQSVTQVSPPGWNGLYPDYEKAQIVYFHVIDADSGDLQQLTFVLNHRVFGVEQCADLLSEIGANKADLVCADTKSTIKNIVGRAAPHSFNPKDFFELLRSKSKNPKDKVFDVIERDLERIAKGEDISILPSACEDFIEDVRDFILENVSKLYDFTFQAQVSDRIEETIYKIAEYILGFGTVPNISLSPLAAALLGSVSTQEFNVVPAPNQNESISWRERYGAIIARLEEISGCAGGGRSMNAVGGIFSVGAEIRLGSALKLIIIRGGIASEYHLGSCVACKGENVLVGECNICTNCE